jgi:hypothetical protein
MEAIRKACMSSLSRTDPSRIDRMAAPPVGRSRARCDRRRSPARPSS